MRRFISTCIGICFCYFVSAQSGQGPAIQQIVPASPQASALARYINYQVNYCNGLPQIEIPIYEIKDGDITIPISLSYHASGIKVNEVSGWAGLGWTLNAEPTLSRSIHGKADEEAYTQDVSPTIKNPNDQQYLKHLAEGNYDEQPDEFYYKLTNKSGKFYLRKDYQQPLQVIPEPYNHIAVITDPSLQALKINDGNGLVYAFDNVNYQEIAQGPHYWWTGWKPSSITSLVTGSNVHFSYYPANLISYSVSQVDYISILDSLTGEQGHYSLSGGGGYTTDLFCCTFTSTNQQSPADYEKPLPIVIYGTNGMKYQYSVGSGGQLASIYTPEPYTGGGNSGYGTKPVDVNRMDFRGGSVVFYKTDSLYSALDSIRVFSGSQVLKTFRFYHSYFNSDVPDQSWRLRLDSFAACDADGKVVEKYKFGYIGDGILPNFFSKAMDLWGYYNGQQASHDETFVPSLNNIPARGLDPNFYSNQAITLNIPGSTHRNVNEMYMQLGTLNSITYPTGGRTEFVYEANRYKDPVNYSINLAGGLRIKQIKHVDPLGANTMVRTFKYGVNEDGGGYLKVPMTLENYYTVSQDVYVNVGGRSPVLGVDVSGLVYGVRRRTYTCNSMQDMFFSAGAPVSYPQVTEYIGQPDAIVPNPIATIGKTVYTYNVMNNTYNPYYPKISGTTLIYGNETDWNLNPLYDKKTYKYSDKVYNAYKPVQHVLYGNGSVNVPNKTFTTGMTYMARNVICMQNQAECDRYDQVQYVSYTTTTGDNRLIWQKDSALYDDHSSVVASKIFAYDDSLNLVREATVDSRGDSVVTTYTYPYNGAPVLSNHIANNMVTQEITKNTYRNGNQIESLKTNYFPEGSPSSGDQLLPSSIYYTKGNGDAEKRIVLSKYGPYKNLVEQSKASGYLHSYIWDYQNVYPVAEVLNADSASIAYTSFEADGRGNWSVTGAGTIVTDATSPTGNKSYALNSGTIAKSGLNTAKSFVVSYWSKNGSAIVNGATVTGSFSKNGWTYYQHTLSPGTVSATLTGNVTIDELRLYPADAQMTTYSYIPLTGMSAKCDASNIITYYEYDSFGRLKDIRDPDRNIIKTIEYNYKK
jgi:YD repeat-containing protein